nr:hypothetical protein B7L51_19315 [Pectobacterium carotovorum]
MAYTNVVAIPMGSSSFDAFKYFQHNSKYILSGTASFNQSPPPRKTIIQIIIEFLNRRIQP